MLLYYLATSKFLEARADLSAGLLRSIDFLSETRMDGVFFEILEFFERRSGFGRAAFAVDGLRSLRAGGDGYRLGSVTSLLEFLGDSEGVGCRAGSSCSLTAVAGGCFSWA